MGTSRHYRWLLRYRKKTWDERATSERTKGNEKPERSCCCCWWWSCIEGHEIRSCASLLFWCSCLLSIAGLVFLAFLSVSLVKSVNLVHPRTDVSRVTAATRDKYITYRTDTGRSAVSASRHTGLIPATRLRYTQGFRIPKFFIP